MYFFLFKIRQQLTLNILPSKTEQRYCNFLQPFVNGLEEASLKGTKTFLADSVNAHDRNFVCVFTKQSFGGMHASLLPGSTD